MLRKYKQRNYNVAHTKQRFSIKKFKFGVASVLIGLTFLGMSSHSVLADESSIMSTEVPKLMANIQRLKTPTLLNKSRQGSLSTPACLKSKNK